MPPFHLSKIASKMHPGKRKGIPALSFSKFFNQIPAMAETKPALLMGVEINGFPEKGRPSALEHAAKLLEEAKAALAAALSGGTKVERAGNALVWFREGDAPSLNGLLKEAEGLQQNFERWVSDYAAVRICPCEACRSVGEGYLRIGAYWGEVGFLRLAGMAKPIGKSLDKLQALWEEAPADLAGLLLAEDVLLRLPGREALPPRLEPQRHSNGADGANAILSYPISSQNQEEKGQNTSGFAFSNPPARTFEAFVPADSLEVFELLFDRAQRSEWLPEMHFLLPQKLLVNRHGSMAEGSCHGKRILVETAGDGLGAFVEIWREMSPAGQIEVRFSVRAEQNGSRIAIDWYFPKTSLLKAIALRRLLQRLYTDSENAIARLKAIFV